jgi:hypothetical protein
MSPELQEALSVLVTAATSGLVANVAGNRRVRVLARKVREQAKELRRLAEEHSNHRKACEEGRSAVTIHQRQSERRIAWLMGGFQAVAAHLRLRPAPLAVAADAESTGGHVPTMRAE